MMYQIVLNNAISEDDTYDNARDALAACESIRDVFGQDAVTVLRDGVPISDSELTTDADIQSCIDQQTTLPSTYQHGFVGRNSDVALGADGYRHGGKTPPNPDDTCD